MELPSAPLRLDVPAHVHERTTTLPRGCKAQPYSAVAHVAARQRAWACLTASPSAHGAVADTALLFGGDDPAETQTASVADIVDDPAALMDDRVVVTGRIEELLTDRALAIGSDTAADDVLVLLAPSALIRGYGLGTTTGIPLPVGATYEQGDVVQFAGTLREFDREALSEDLGLVLNDELFDRWSDDPALVIDRLDVATVGRPLLLKTAAPA